MIAEPVSAAGSLKNLIKNPLFYVIAVFVIVGGWLVKDAAIGPAWFIGLSLIIFACIVFLIHVIASLFDASFKRRYDGIFKAQEKTINIQNRVIVQLSRNTITAFGNMSDVSETMSSGYIRRRGNTDSETTTSSNEV